METENPGKPRLPEETPSPDEVPAGVDRRTFLMRNAVIGASAVMTGVTWTPEARAAQAARSPVMSKTWLPANSTS